MSYPNNPLSYYSGYISACRNIFLTSSIAIALFGYSSTFKINSSINIVKISSLGILIFSILYSINTNYGMYKYIKYIKTLNTPIEEHIQLNLWNNYMILTGFYTILLIIILLVGLRRLIFRISDSNF